MDNSIVDKAKSYTEELFSKEVPKEFSYHNFNHTSNVVAALDKMSKKAQLDDERKEILYIAAYFHDLGFTKDPDNHEEHSKKIAQEFLIENNYPPQKIDQVLKCIDATKMDWKGDDHLCCIIKDADLSGLASNDYENISENLRKEMSFREDKDIDQNIWIEKNIEFLNEHEYLSKEGKELFQEGKLSNLTKLKSRDISHKAKKKNKNKNKNKNKKKIIQSISNSKSAQTQFKTALRNHIDLSSIADNKANIMLSVNAIVITVGLPLLLDRAADIPELYVSIIMLSIVCLISMIFATLATRPIQMKGTIDLEEIKLKKTNLFFFGNYYKMKIDDYEQAVQAVISDEEILDNSIIRDLFFLGKSLGKKFDYLRWCYNIFMYGIVIAVFASIINFIL